MNCWKKCMAECGVVECTEIGCDVSYRSPLPRRNTEVTKLTTISAIPPTSSSRCGLRNASQTASGGQWIPKSRKASRQASTPDRNPTAVATRRFFSGVIGAVSGSGSELEKHFRRHLKTTAQPSDVFGVQFSFSAQHFGSDAGRPEHIQQIFLFQVVRQHQLVQHFDRASGLERVLPLFEIFNEQRQKFGHA